MSRQFWLVRACPNTWRDIHMSLFLWINKKVVGKRKTLDQTQEDFTLMSKNWVYGFVRWMRLWKKMGFIPEQPYEVSSFWGSARPLGRWGNVLNIWCSWLFQIDSLPFPVLLWTPELQTLKHRGLVHVDGTSPGRRLRCRGQRLQTIDSDLSLDKSRGKHLFLTRSNSEVLLGKYKQQVFIQWCCWPLATLRRLWVVDGSALLKLHSTCGPLTCSASITWEPLRNAAFWLYHGSTAFYQYRCKYTLKLEKHH